MKVAVWGFAVMRAIIQVLWTICVEAVITFLSMYERFPILQPEEPQHRRRPFSPREKAALYHLQRGRCAGCKERLASRLLEVDHIVPLARDGDERFDNKQLLCASCNRVKGDRPQEYLLQTLRERGLR